MSRARPARRRGFTLVEMLVVLGIIAVLAALLLPAVMSAVGRARNAAIALEVNQLASAIESYKQEKGDYPPNFRDYNVVTRHIRRCYPKIDQTYFAAFMKVVFPPDGVTNTTASISPVIDESESLVFWLSLTDNNPRYPFLRAYNPGGLAVNPKAYYPFDETRLSKTLSADIPSYKAKYCKDTYYIYIDSRSYVDLCRIKGYGTDTISTYGYADDADVGVRPYWSDNVASTTALLDRDRYKPMNPTTFQIICAGQDGEFGLSAADPDVKQFPSGTYYTAGDKDNITNFSNGRRLVDNMP